MKSIANTIIFIIQLCILSIALSTAYAKEHLIIEPDAGPEPILKAIQHAKSSIDLVMYGFTDERFIQALIQAKSAGKQVQILLEPHPYKAENENKFAIKHLESADVNLQWPNPDFKLTHQKTMIIDQNRAFVMTFNFTHSSFRNERNFGLVIDNPEMVDEIANVFAADWVHKETKMEQPNLIWSPDNSRQKIIHFIKSAKSEIKIYADDLSDYQIIGAFGKAARTGKLVQILMSKPKEELHGKIEFLRNKGAIIRYSKNYRIHAKVIIVDNQQAILGSINWTRPSLQSNRELSVITSDPEVIHELVYTFDHDWRDTSGTVIKKVDHHRIRLSKKVINEIKQVAEKLF